MRKSAAIFLSLFTSLTSLPVVAASPATCPAPLKSKTIANHAYCSIDLKTTSAESIATTDLSSVTWLHVTNAQDAVPLAAILTREDLSHLIALDVSWNPSGPGLAAIFQSAPFRSKIARLDIAYTRADPATVAAVIGSGICPSLKHLGLKGLSLGPDGLKTVLDALNSNSCTLTSLDLNTNNIGDKGIPLLDSPALHNLETIDLGFNDIGDEGAAALVKMPAVRKLVALDLNYNRITDPGANAIASSPLLQNLTLLNLNYNYIGDYGAEAISRSSSLKNIEDLGLWHNNVGNPGAMALTTASFAWNLRRLNLCHNDITDEGAVVLSSDTNFPSLEFINISTNPITDYTVFDTISLRGVQIVR